MKEIAKFLNWATEHKQAFLCHLTEDCDCPWVEYTEEELEALILEYEESA